MTPKDCLFCKIIDKEIPATIIYQDDTVIAFDDIRPQAPIHKLIVPRKHIATLDDLNDEDTLIAGHLIQVARKIAHQLGIVEAGYRVVNNCNAGAGQEVFHIHFHLLGGRRFTWPPG